MTRNEPIAETLARFLVDTPFLAVPDDAVHAARRCLLDWWGSALRGSIEPPASMAREAVERVMSGRGARRVPDGAPSSVAGAAFVNGIASHIVEMDDLHHPSTFHPGAPIIPAALAAAEAEESSGEELLRAIVLGYEVGIRVAEAVNPTHYRYWHPTGTCGTFGAAAAVGVILGLDAPALADAFGSAGTQASGLWAFIDEGSMSKHLHAGRAAENGLLAACLAASGFSGARHIVESPRGFVAATTDNADATIALDGLGSVPLKILENGFKVHACCGHTHTAIDLAIELGERMPVERMRHVRVATYQAALDVAGIEEPRTGYEARFSLKYAVAAGLTRGVADLDVFADNSLNDEQLRDMMRRISTSVDPEINAEYPRQWGCRMEIETLDGERLRGEVSHPRGMPANPLSDGELEAKYLSLASPAIGAERARRLAEVIWALPAGNAAELFDVIGHQAAVLH